MNTLTLKLEILAIVSQMKTEENPLALAEEMYQWVMLEAKESNGSAELHSIN